MSIETAEYTFTHEPTQLPPGCVTKEGVSEHLVGLIRCAARNADFYAARWAFFDFCGVAKAAHHARIMALKQARALWTLKELYTEVAISRFDHIPELAEQVNAAAVGEGFASWLMHHEGEAARRTESEVLDAIRCLTIGAGLVPSVDGSSLTTWRSLTDVEKRDLVENFHRRGPNDKRPLARGAVWPTSTFDAVPWACGDTFRRPKAEVLSCNEPAGHAGLMHSDGNASWNGAMSAALSALSQEDRGVMIPGVPDSPTPGVMVHIDFAARPTTGVVKTIKRTIATRPLVCDLSRASDAHTVTLEEHARALDEEIAKALLGESLTRTSR